MQDTLTKGGDKDATSFKKQEQDADDGISVSSRSRQDHGDSHQSQKFNTRFKPPLKDNLDKNSENFLENHMNMISNENPKFTNDLGRNVTRVKKINRLLTKRDVVERQDSQQLKVEKSKSRYLQPWPIVVISIICTFLFVEMCLIILVTAVIDPYLTALNEPKFQEFENPIEDIIENTIPFIKGWVEREIPSDATTLLVTQDLKLEPTERNNECLEKYFVDLQTHIPTTSPKYVDLVLRNLGAHIPC